MMYLKYCKKISVLSYLLLLLSCGTQNKESNFDPLFDYMQQKHSLSIEKTQNRIIIAVPVGSCTPCVQDALEIAIKFSKKKELLTLLIYKLKKERYKYENYINQIPQDRVLSDSPSNTFKYGITSGAPRLYVVSNGEVRLTTEISDLNKAEIITYITKLYNEHVFEES